METKLMYLILGGWALMLFLPSFIPAVMSAAGFGGAAAFVVFLGNGGEGDLIRTMIVISPIATISVFVAWPIGAVFRWILRRDPLM